jgi:signal transduction histidine kinase
MKLFSRYSRVILLANITIFLVASVAFYFSLRFVLVKQIDDDLVIEEDEITAYVGKYNRLPESFSFSDQVISFSKNAGKTDRHFKIVEMRDLQDNSSEPFRQLTFGIKAGDQQYKVDVSKSLEGTNNLLRSILTISISTILLILLVSAFINRVLLKRLWKPFYQSLNAVKNFRVSKTEQVSLPETRIEEFALLNSTLQKVTDNSRLEYISLKTFSENASHEIQTPIAIIRSKLDLLIQDEQLSKQQSDILESAYNAIEKLARLNQSLLLLAKIENRQYEDVELVDMKRKIEEKIQDFKELWQSRSIQVNPSLENASTRMNKELADILLNNMLANATSHNYDGGTVSILLAKDQLTITNTSRQPELEGKKMFGRFYKPGFGSSNTGLGLSIIKQIAESSVLDLRYAFAANEHTFIISWKSKK